MILFDGKIKKNIPNEKIKCLKFLKKNKDMLRLCKNVSI